jgi:Na+/H+ antiporter NhaD/arsenite permease-like protein
MTTLIIIVFVIGYILITLEHPIRLNKTATALITGVLCWTLYILNVPEPEPVLEGLGHHLAEIAQILFFLMGAMTIVELIDIHDGFSIITDRIASRNARVLLWLICGLTFFLSAMLDNLASAIVMVSVTRKLVKDPEQRRLMAGMIIIAANAGGAWSPIGDVTTTMLWIGGQVTTMNIITQLFLPSLVCLLVPLVWLTFTIKPTSETEIATAKKGISRPYVTPLHRRDRATMFYAGLTAIILVPVFKTITHLPPYMAMMLALGAVWVVSEIIHADKDEEHRKRFTAAYALSKIDIPSILFFLGILLAVGALQSTKILSSVALSLNEAVGDLDLIVMIIGVASAIVDNVPIVAAAMGMYDMTTYPPDAKLWEFLAYCAGTGGSLLVIGSAAGVAVMGMEKLEFGWYLRRISGLALLGYVAGALTYFAVYGLTH